MPPGVDAITANAGFVPSVGPQRTLKTVETEIKYAGYPGPADAAPSTKPEEGRRVHPASPTWFDYRAVSGLSPARCSPGPSTRVRPITLGQASRLPGVTPAAVGLIPVFIEIQGKKLAS